MEFVFSNQIFKNKQTGVLGRQTAQTPQKDWWIPQRYWHI